MRLNEAMPFLYAVRRPVGVPRRGTWLVGFGDGWRKPHPRLGRLKDAKWTMSESTARGWATRATNEDALEGGDGQTFVVVRFRLVWDRGQEGVLTTRAEGLATRVLAGDLAEAYRLAEAVAAGEA